MAFGYPYVSDVSLKEGVYVDNAVLDGERIDQYLKGAGGISEVMNSAVVYAYGNSADFGPKNFPILFQTQGQGNKKGYTTFDNQVKNYMLGKPKKTSVIAKTVYPDSEKCGRNHTDIIMYFKDNHFTAGEIIVKGTPMRNYQIQLITAGVRDQGCWKFVGRVFGNTSSFVPASQLKANEIWGDGPYKVSLENSRGNQNRTYTPFPTTNTLSLMRQSINVAGNSSKKKMNFTIKVDGQTFNLYYDWEKHLTNLQFMAVKEQDLIMSKQTKDRTGYIQNIDINSGKPIPSGNGVIGQIPKSNVLSYIGDLTERKMSNFLTDTMSIAGTLTTDSNVVIDIMCGFDLLENINRALSKSLAMRPVINNTDMYVRNGKNGLQYGSYFTEYKHISGVIFRFTHHNFFDESSLAQTSAKNPFTGRSVLSSEGIIMNFGRISYSDQNGSKEASNIEYMFEEGREYIEGTVRGLAAIEGKQGGEMATDIDASALHMMCTQGVHCYSPLSMGYIQYNLR